MNKLKPLLMTFLIVMLPISFAYQINYDANGNVIWDEKSNLFREYDSLNRLRYIYNGTSNSDPLLQEIIMHPVEERVWVKKNYNSSGDVFETFYYLSKKFVRKENASGNHSFAYVYMDDGSLVAQVNPDNTTLYFLTDNLGSNAIVTDENGDLVERNFYSPFGVPLDSNDATDRLYENKEYDKITKTYDFHFRMFNGENGPPVFLQPDSLIQNLYEPQMLNRYSFETNNPYKYTDPDGHNPAVFYASTFVGVGAATWYWITTPIDRENPQWGERLRRGLLHGANAGGHTALTLYSGFTTAGGALRLAGGSFTKKAGLAGLSSISQTFYSSLINQQSISYTDASADLAISMVSGGLSKGGGTYWPTANAITRQTLNTIGNYWTNFATIQASQGFLNLLQQHQTNTNSGGVCDQDMSCEGGSGGGGSGGGESDFDFSDYDFCIGEGCP